MWVPPKADMVSPAHVAAAHTDWAGLTDDTKVSSRAKCCLHSFNAKS